MNTHPGHPQVRPSNRVRRALVAATAACVCWGAASAVRAEDEPFDEPDEPAQAEPMPSDPAMDLPFPPFPPEPMPPEPSTPEPAPQQAAPPRTAPTPAAPARTPQPARPAPTPAPAAAQPVRQTPAQRPAPDEAFSSRYGVLLENNPFRRDRRPPPPPPRQTPTVAPPPAPAETRWMLTGIVFEDGGFRAYLEDLRAGTVTRVVPGEPIANGIVSEVMFDAISYTAEGQVVWIGVGQDLTGRAPTNLARSSGPSGGQAASGANGAPSAAPGGAGGAVAPGSPETLSIEERLRRRRLEGR